MVSIEPFHQENLPIDTLPAAGNLEMHTGCYWAQRANIKYDRGKSFVMEQPARSWRQVCRYVPRQLCMHDDSVRCPPCFVLRPLRVSWRTCVCHTCILHVRMSAFCLLRYTQMCNNNRHWSSLSRTYVLYWYCTCALPTCPASDPLPPPYISPKFALPSACAYCIPGHLFLHPCHLSMPT